MRYFPAAEITNALAIMKAESGGYTWATDYDRNGSVDRGCMEVNSIHARLVNGDLQTLYDPVTNARVAEYIWARDGWCAWTTAHKLGLCNRK